MNNEELFHENQMLKAEIEKLKSQLESFTNSRKAYYEKNKELIHKKNEKRNSEKITCICGAVIRKDSIYKHIKENRTMIK